MLILVLSYSVLTLMSGHAQQLVRVVNDQLSAWKRCNSFNKHTQRHCLLHCYRRFTSFAVYMVFLVHHKLHAFQVAFDQTVASSDRQCSKNHTAVRPHFCCRCHFFWSVALRWSCKGLSMFVKRFNRKTRLHLGPTGALRVPLNKFSPELRHLQRGMEKVQTTREHEILNTLAQSSEPGDHARDLSARPSDICPDAVLGEQANSCHGPRDGPGGHDQPLAAYDATHPGPDPSSHAAHTDPSHAYMPGFKGHRARQMTQELEILEDQVNWDISAGPSRLSTSSMSGGWPSWTEFTVISGGSGRHNKAAPQTPPRNTKKGMPVVNPMTPPPGEIPQRRCQLPSAILITRKEGPNYLRQFWRCANWNKPTGCAFFMWLEKQPYWAPTKNQASEESPTSAGTDWEVESQIPMVAAVDPVCTHVRTCRRGSNAFVTQITCLDCGHLVSKKQNTNKTASSTSAEETAMWAEFEEFQNFKQRCQMRQRGQHG